MNLALKSLIKTSAAGVALTLAAGLAQAESPTVAPEIEKFVSTLTRAQVVAEAAEARRLGLIAYGDGPAPIATPQQLDRIRMAGLRGLSTTASR